MWRQGRRWAGAGLLLWLAACSGSRPAGRPAAPRRVVAGPAVQKGLGSYYADKFAGRATASGSIYRPNQMTCAHNTLPFGTQVRVTNLRNGRHVDLTVTDRGPHTKGYIVDVSRRAAELLDLVQAGVVPVTVQVLKPAR